MVDIHAHPGGSLAIGRRGENDARRVVFDLSAWRRHYGEGTVQLLHQRAGDESPYPCTLTVEGDTAYWLIRAADVDKAGWGSVQLHYYVGDTLAKSAIWRTVTADALGDPSEPPEDPAKAWFAVIREQIGNLDELTTAAKDNLVAAINEAAKSGGGAGSISMRVSGGYIQYSTNGGASWDNLIATADLQGPKGDSGTDGTPGKDGTDGITPHIGDNGNWYLDDTDTGKPSRGKTGPQGPAGPAGADGKDGAGMDITGATVGQIAKVKAVDADGKPTAWEPVNMPSSGGGEKEWNKIIDVEITEATMVFEATGLDNVTELYCEWSGLKTASETNKRDLDLFINDIAVGSGWVTNAASNGNALYGYSMSIYNGFVWHNTKSAGIAGASNAHNTSMGNNAKISYGLTHGVGAATKVKIKAVNADNAPVTGRLEVWAR